jgi:hypothetical protein
MARPRSRLAHLLLLAMTVSSCTCGNEAPPKPAAVPTKAPVAAPPVAAKPTDTAAPIVATPTAASLVTPSPSDVALPDNFPKDIAVMEGSTLAAVQKLGGGAQNVLFTTQAEGAKVFEYYKDDLKQKGHEVTQQYQTSEQSFLSFKKGNNVTNVVIAKDPKDPKKRVVAIMYYEEQPTEDF